MEYISCDLCGSDETELYFRARDRQHQRGDLFNLVRCKKCGLIYLNPRPTKEEILHLYPEEQYYPYERIFRGIPDKQVLKSYKRLTEKLLAPMKKGRLLDVGCGDGYFLKGVQGYGWEVFGVEISPLASAFARERLGLNIFTGDLLETHFPEEHFDAITLFEVLEHLPNPSETLSEIRRILKGDGLLLITVPNIQSLQTRIFKQCCMTLDIPRHLHHFSSETLGHLLEKTDFQLLEVRYSADMKSFLHTIAHVLKDIIGKQSHGNNMRSSLVAAKRLKTSLKRKLVGAVNLSLWPVGYALAKFKLSAGMWAYAKKK